MTRRASLVDTSQSAPAFQRGSDAADSECIHFFDTQEERLEVEIPIILAMPQNT